jgi:hypothetical protein
MDPGFQEKQPYNDTHGDPKVFGIKPKVSEDPKDDHGEKCKQDETILDFLTVKNGNYQHGTNIIHNGKCSQEHLQCNRHTFAQGVDDRKGEGNIGCHGDAPTGQCICD